MSVILVEGGRKLSGAVTVQGAKNSVLPMLAATVLCPGVCCLRECPALSDVDTAVQIIRHLGGTVHREGPDLVVDTRQITGCEIPEELMGRMRSSVMFLGAILGRCGEAVCSQPGGCDLGPGLSTCICMRCAPWARKLRKKAAACGAGALPCTGQKYSCVHPVWELRRMHSGGLRRLRHNGHIQRRTGAGNHGAAGLSKGHGCMRPGSRQRHRGGEGTGKSSTAAPIGCVRTALWRLHICAQRPVRAAVYTCTGRIIATWQRCCASCRKAAARSAATAGASA